MICRFCETFLGESFLDLGEMPPSNSLQLTSTIFESQKTYPLKVHHCTKCQLMQISENVDPIELFCDDYPYYSSTSTTWLEHAAQFTTRIIKDLNLTIDHRILEIASNDGYLLKNFVSLGFPCLGVDPAPNVASAARKIGVPTITKFFSHDLVDDILQSLGKADIVIANNVLAHVPNIKDFLRGVKKVLNNNGTAIFEFPHVLELFKNNQFDTIYHEHFFYFSVNALMNILPSFGLRIFKVMKLTTHGGSLRIYVCHVFDDRETEESVEDILKEEQALHQNNTGIITRAQERVSKIREDFLLFISDALRKNKKIVGYGAAAKTNTILNFCKIDYRSIDKVYEKSESKIGKFLPMSGIPICSIKQISDDFFDFIIIFPWNIKDEIVAEIYQKKKEPFWFVTLIPSLKIEKYEAIQ